MRFFNIVAAVALGLATAAHGRMQIMYLISILPPAAAPTSASISQPPGGVFITALSAEPTAPESSVETSVPASSTAAMPQPPQPTAGSSSSSPLSPSNPYGFSNGTAPTNTSTTAGSKCSKEGQYNCQPDGQAYQRCAAGLWSVTMPVALGNPCKPGLADTFVSAQKRSSPGFVRRRRFVSDHRRGKRVSPRIG
ncbi:hypothetical protein TGAM01_v208257 [Trichoderma gamsii]|uniref:Carbohydrate-binding module family 19 domain-containing protein n=1 Tax=Trichoderma gamsii TaxID=398673 RepID=A0A2P4ZER8_9HYPO|nr:hypothetical protein TGAM01_v208257 [Trichoderma gamsii]PON22777.1 hypothetical protein TGAM01_v208257 [Trichoderma gamsii]